MKDLSKKIENIFSEENRLSWESVSFGDVVTEIKENLSGTASENIEHVVGLENIDPLDIHIRSWGHPSTGTTFTKKFKTGQTLFGRRRSYQRKAALAEFDGICSGDIIVLEAKSGKLSTKLLPFIVHSDNFFKWAVSTSAGSLSPRTKFKSLSEFEFRLPPIFVQEKLADLFQAIDRLMEKNRKLQFTAEKLRLVQTNAIFGEDQNKKIRIGEVATVRAGYGFPHSLQGKISGQFPFFKVSDMNLSTKYSSSSVNYIDSADLKILNAKLFPDKTIIFPKVGAAIYTNKKRLLTTPSLIDNNVMGVTVDTDKYLPEYIFHFFINLDLAKVATKGALPAISAEAIKNLEIPDLTIKSQQNVVNRLSKTDQYIEDLNSYHHNLLSLRQSLLNKII